MDSQKPKILINDLDAKDPKLVIDLWLQSAMLNANLVPWKLQILDRNSIVDVTEADGAIEQK